MSDFRYNDDAEALEENLEEVLSSHQKEQEDVAKEAAASAPTELPALERIASSGILDQVNHVAEAEQKTASDAILEHRVRGALREKVAEKTLLVTDFLEEVEKDAGMAGTVGHLGGKGLAAAGAKRIGALTAARKGMAGTVSHLGGKGLATAGAKRIGALEAARRAAQTVTK